MKATSGDVDALKITGVYRYSRNMADMAILIGWAVLCASVTALPVVAMGIVVLLVEKRLRQIPGRVLPAGSPIPVVSQIPPISTVC